MRVGSTKMLAPHFLDHARRGDDTDSLKLAQSEKVIITGDHDVCCRGDRDFKDSIVVRIIGDSHNGIERGDREECLAYQVNDGFNLTSSKAELGPEQDTLKFSQQSA